MNLSHGSSQWMTSCVQLLGLELEALTRQNSKHRSTQMAECLGVCIICYLQPFTRTTKINRMANVPKLC